MESRGLELVGGGEELEIACAWGVVCDGLQSFAPRGFGIDAERGRLSVQPGVVVGVMEFSCWGYGVIGVIKVVVVRCVLRLSLAVCVVSLCVVCVCVVGVLGVVWWALDRDPERERKREKEKERERERERERDGEGPQEVRLRFLEHVWKLACKRIIGVTRVIRYQVIGL